MSCCRRVGRHADLGDCRACSAGRGGCQRCCWYRCFAVGLGQDGNRGSLDGRHQPVRHARSVRVPAGADAQPGSALPGGDGGGGLPAGCDRHRRGPFRPGALPLRAAARTIVGRPRAYPAWPGGASSPSFRPDCISRAACLACATNGRQRARLPGRLGKHQLLRPWPKVSFHLTARDPIIGSAP